VPVVALGQWASSSSSDIGMPVKLPGRTGHRRHHLRRRELSRDMQHGPGAGAERRARVSVIFVLVDTEGGSGSPLARRETATLVMANCVGTVRRPCLL
jgi:hypothetical protein